jgi:enamine deaminase RidA (YjgF/YER057c/UK114 family)
MKIEAKLGAMGLILPAPLVPPGNFELVTVHGDLAYVAGHGPFDGSTLLVEGLVGRDLTIDQAYEAARLTTLSILASLKRELGELDRVTRWLRAVGYVHCAPGFTQNAAVVNGLATSSSNSGARLAGTRAQHRDRAPRR